MVAVLETYKNFFGYEYSGNVSASAGGVDVFDAHHLSERDRARSLAMGAQSQSDVSPARSVSRAAPRRPVCRPEDLCRGARLGGGDLDLRLVVLYPKGG